MSIRILSPILRDQQYEGKQKLIMVALADMVNDEGIGFASYRQIRQIAQVSDEYIRQSVARFIEDGRLEIVEKGSGPGRATVYRVLLPNSVAENETDQNSPTELRRDKNSPTELAGTPQLSGGELPNSTLISSLEAPSLETPSLEEGRSPNGSPAESENQRAQRITKVYTELVPLSKFPAVMAIVKKALKVYDEATVSDALRRLADEGRSVTVDTLRYEIEGMPDFRKTAQQRRSDDFAATMAWAKAQDERRGLEAVGGMSDTREPFRALTAAPGGNHDDSRLEAR